MATASTAAHEEPQDATASLRRLPLVAAVALGGVATIAAAAWILWDATGTAKGERFIAKPQFLIWLLILCAQSAVWFLAIVPVASIVTRVWSQLRTERHLLRRTTVAVVASTVLLILLALALSLPASALPNVGPLEKLARALNRLPSGDEWPLPHHVLKMQVLTGVGFAVGLMAVIGIWLIAIAFGRIASASDVSDRATLERFLCLRDELSLLLGIVGAIVGLGTLATGALRNAVLAVHVQFPAEYILVFGLYYSGLIALAYAPAFVAMRAAGERICNCSYPLKGPNEAGFGERLEERKALGELLQLNLAASSTFKAGFAVLTPLAGSLVGLLIGK